MAHWILRILGWGGARFERRGVLPTTEPSYVVMNHQSQLDICTAAEMGEPYTPIFVPRARYARFIPLISKTIRMIGCPIVDPQRDVRGALRAMKKAAVELRGALLVFPEGHRSRDGEVLPFRARGMVSLLQTRRLPVYVIANDGLWRARRFVDLLFHGAALHGETELLGPFLPPEDDAALEAFVATLREQLVASVLADAHAPARGVNLGDAVRAHVTDTAGLDPVAARLAALCAESGGDAVSAVLFFGSRKTGAAPDPWSAYDFFVLTSDDRAFYRELRHAASCAARPAWSQP